MVNKAAVAGLDMERALFKAVEARFLVRLLSGCKAFVCVSDVFCFQLVHFA